MLCERYIYFDVHNQHLTRTSHIVQIAYIGLRFVLLYNSLRLDAFQWHLTSVWHWFDKASPTFSLEALATAAMPRAADAGSDKLAHVRYQTEALVMCHNEAMRNRLK